MISLPGFAPQHKASRLGPWTHNGVAYCIAPLTPASTSGQVGVFKLISGAWVQAGVINARTADGSYQCYSGQIAGNDLIVAHMAPNASAGFTAFNLTTETAGDFVPIGFAPASDITGSRFVMAGRRDDGAVIFLIASSESVMGGRRRVSVWRHQNGVWTDHGFVDGGGTTANIDPKGLLVVGNRTFIFYVNSSVTGRSRVRVLTAANTFGAIAPSVGANTTNTHNVGAATLVREQIFNPGASGAGTMQASRHANTDDALIALENPNISDAGNTALNTAPGGVAIAEGTTTHLFWIRASDGAVMRDNDGGAEAWGADEVFLSGATTSLYAGVVPGGIGVITESGDGLRYDHLALGAPPATPSVLKLYLRGA